MASKSLLRRRIFRRRLRLVEVQGIKDTGRSLEYVAKRAIPDDVIEILSVYLDEVCQLNSKQLQAEAKRYTSGK